MICKKKKKDPFLLELNWPHDPNEMLPWHFQRNNFLIVGFGFVQLQVKKTQLVAKPWWVV